MNTSDKPVDPFGARSGDALAYMRNPGDGRADQLVISYRGQHAWKEMTPAQCIRLAEDLLRRARAMKTEGRGG